MLKMLRNGAALILSVTMSLQLSMGGLYSVNADETGNASEEQIVQTQSEKQIASKLIVEYVDQDGSLLNNQEINLADQFVEDEISLGAYGVQTSMEGYQLVSIQDKNNPSITYTKDTTSVKCTGEVTSIQMVFEKEEVSTPTNAPEDASQDVEASTYKEKIYPEYGNAQTMGDNSYDSHYAEFLNDPNHEKMDQYKDPSKHYVIVGHSGNVNQITYVRCDVWQSIENKPDINPTKHTYVVKYERENGTEIGKEFVQENSNPINVPSNLGNGYWTVKGKTEQLSSEEVAKYPINEPTTFVWHEVKEVKFDVIYDGNGYDGKVPDKTTVLQNKPHTVSNMEMKRAGYRFLGWNTKKDGTGTTYQAGDTFTVEQNVTLYAKWEKDVVTTSEDVYVYVKITGYPTGSLTVNKDGWYTVGKTKLEVPKDQSVNNPKVPNKYDLIKNNDVTLDSVKASLLSKDFQHFAKNEALSADLIAPEMTGKNTSLIKVNSGATDYVSSGNTWHLNVEIEYKEVEKIFCNIIYNDGVENEEIFKDQKYVQMQGLETPAFDFDSNQPGNQNPVRKGYTFKGWDPAVENTVTKNVIYKAKWEKDSNQTQDTHYKVIYKKEGKVDTNSSYQVSGKAWINDNPAKIEVKSIEAPNNKYVGYTLDPNNQIPKPGTMVESGTEIVVNYVKDTTQTQKTKYIVHYAKDGVIQETKEFTSSAWINDDPAMIKVESIATPNNKYVGYKLDPNNKIPEPETMVKSGTEIVVNYIKEQYDVTVEYYFDEVLEKDKTKTEKVDYDTVYTINPHTSVTLNGTTYVLDTVKNNGLKVSIDARKNVVKVYYAKDTEGGKEPINPVYPEVKPDGIPDKYQATVIFKVVNGTFNNVSYGNLDSTKTTVTQKYITGEKGTDGYWKPIKTQIKEIPTSTANKGYVGGSWKPIPSTELEVVDGASYTYTYEKGSYPLTIDYVDEEGKPLKGVPSHTGKYEFGQEYSVESPIVEGYVLSDENQATIQGIMDTEEGKTIKVVYTKDEHGTDPTKPDSGDNIPDKYQVKVTFAAENGSVSFDKTWVTLKDEKGNYSEIGKGYLTSAHIPTATANQGYNQDTLVWNPDTGIAIDKNGAHFVAKFDKAYKSLKYYVEYFVDGEGAPRITTDHNVDIWVNEDTYSVESVDTKTIPGYQLSIEKSDQLPKTVNDHGKVKVIYVVDQSVQDYPYIIHYVDKETKTDLKTVQGTGYIGEKIDIPTEEFTGYTARKSNPTTLTIKEDGTTEVFVYYDINTYDVRWVNDDERETILEHDTSVKYGTTPEFNGKTPTKESDKQYDYTFAGWTPDLKPVTENVIYKAQYSKKVRSYEYSVKYRYDGKVKDPYQGAPTGGIAEYGSTVSVTPKQTVQIGDKNYVLVSKNHTISIEEHKGKNIIYVDYELDNNCDNIPDKYQRTVTFIAENGGFNGDVSNTKVELIVTLRNSKGELDKSGSYKLKLSDIPLTNAPKEGYATVIQDVDQFGPYEKHAKWYPKIAVLNGGTTTIQDNQEYRFKYLEEVLPGKSVGARHFTEDKNGQFTQIPIPGGELIGPFSVKKSNPFYEMTDNTFQYLTFKVQAPKGYCFDRLEFRSKASHSTPIYTKLDVLDPATVKPGYLLDYNTVNHYEFAYIYSADTNSNQIPDKYEATVTYKVENGTFNAVPNGNLSEDKTTVTQVYQLGELVNGIWQSKDVNLKGIPTAKPNRGYVKGSWDTEPTTTTKVVDGASYTYTYKKGTYGLTIHYVDEEGNPLVDPFTKDYVFEEAYKVSSPVIEGYVLSDENQATIQGIMDTEGKEITVVYTKDDHGTDPTNPDSGDNIPDKYQVKVTFEGINGDVSFKETWVTLKDENGNYSEQGTGYLTSAQIPNATAHLGYNQASMNWITGEPTTSLPIQKEMKFVVRFELNPVVPVEPTDPTTPAAQTTDSVDRTETETVEDEKTPKADLETEEVREDGTPKGSGAYWALINLICAVLTVLFGLLLLLSKRHKDQDDEEDEEQEEQVMMNTDEEEEEEMPKKRGMFTRVLVVLLAIGSVIFLILTEDMRLPMGWIDKYTIWMVVLGLGQIGVFFIGRRWKDDEKEEDEEQQLA